MRKNNRLSHHGHTSADASRHSTRLPDRKGEIFSKVTPFIFSQAPAAAIIYAVLPDIDRTYHIAYCLLIFRVSYTQNCLVLAVINDNLTGFLSINSIELG